MSIRKPDPPQGVREPQAPRAGRNCIAVALLAFSAAAIGQPVNLDDLPLVEVPVSHERSDLLAFLASGDGGWSKFDQSIAATLASQGIPVIGLNTLKFYWKVKPPEVSAQALEQVLRHYLVKWNKERVLLIGYSFGADVLPFMASRLPPELDARVALIALLAPGTDISFEFRLSYWLGRQPADAVAVQPEVEKLNGQNILCVYGDSEKNSLCPLLPPGLARLDKRHGGHHLGGDAAAIANHIIDEAAR